MNAEALRAQVETLLEDRDRLRGALELLRPQVSAHRLVEEDCWYSCPKATWEDGESAYCGEMPRDVCECGADARAALIAVALREPMPARR